MLYMVKNKALEALQNLLQNINSRVLYIRDPLTLKKERENIETYSKKLKSNYLACYRTLSEMINILENWTITEVIRIYPDSIESEFGTKQFYFKCLKNENN
jgi:hypothetical protein